MPVAVTSYEEVVRWALGPGVGQQGRYVCVANVHMCMEAFDNRDFHRVVDEADLVVPDGRPLVWGLRLLGQKKASQVRGADLMMSLCKKAEKKKIPIGLYGGSPETLSRLVAFMKGALPDLAIPFCSSPPFRPLSKEEDEEYVKEIQRSGAKILFVGLGCPKQEYWMYKHRNRLQCVAVGVGAAFDFISGRKKNAPRYMQKTGLEWIFRLGTEPKRLLARYGRHNPRFIWYFGKQLLRSKQDGDDRVSFE